MVDKEKGGAKYSPSPFFLILYCQKTYSSKNLGVSHQFFMLKVHSDADSQRSLLLSLSYYIITLYYYFLYGKIFT